MRPSNSRCSDQSSRLALTYREAASAIGVCERTIWQLVRDGKLKAKRVTGKSVRIPVAEIARFINEDDEPRATSADGPCGAAECQEESR